MKPRARAAVVAGLLALAGRSVVACAADGNPEPAAPEAATEQVLDAGTLDAVVTAPDAEVDAAIPPPACSVDGWCYSTLPAASSFDAGGTLLGPDGIVFALQSVWVAPDHDAWAVTSAGHVLHWNGTAWNVELVARAGLRAVWGVSATDLWLAGDDGLLLHGTGSAGALSFQPVSLGTSQRVSRIWGTSATDIWVVASGVYHLSAETAATPSPFALVTVPSSYGDAVSSVQITAVWGSASATWFGGRESTFCAPPSCLNASELFVAERKVDAGGAVSWTTVPLPIADAQVLSAGVSTNDGLQVMTVKGDPLFNTGIVARVADDASKLDPKRGAVTVSGAHAWSFEVAENYGLPEGLWGRDSKELWLVGQSGVVRRFDGSAWQISRVARTTLSPLVNDLRAVDAVVDTATGARDMWVVGDDVALHRSATP